jgi:hypothetical protein
MARRTRLPGSQPSPASILEAIPFEPSALSSPLEALVAGPLFEALYHRGRAMGLRDRVLTVPRLALLVLSYVLNAMASQKALLQALFEGQVPGLPPLDLTSQAWSQRLQDVPHSLFLSLLVDATKSLSASPWRRPWVAPLAPWAAGIFALDDTTLDALARKVGWLAALPKGAPETLAGRLGCLLDLTTGKLAEVLYDDDSAANEKTHLRPLLERLVAGSLVVMDLGYFAFELFDWMHQRGLVFVLRLKARVTYRIDRVLADRPLYRDRIVYLGTADKGDRCATPMRLVELCLDGVWWSYLTNELDPARLPAEAVWAVYGERWPLEVSFAAIKGALGLAKLSVSSVNAALIQIWTTLTLYQVLQDLRLQVALEAGWKADDVSWVNLLRRIQAYANKPAPKLPLRDWLRERAKGPGVKKEGTRVRRRTSLPEEVAQACQPTPSASPEPSLPQKERYKQKRKEERRAERKRGSRSRSKPTVAGLLAPPSDLPDTGSEPLN